MKIRRASFQLAVATLVLPLLFGGCGDDLVAPGDVTFAPELGVDLEEMRKLESGVYVKTLQVGLGSYSVDAADSVDLSYTLWLPNGMEVESGEISRYLTSLIPGFRDGVVDMVVGEIRLVVVPPERGYGESPPSGSGIPPNSYLVFRVELLKVAGVP
mgnify:CR=1 FL=1